MRKPVINNPDKSNNKFEVKRVRTISLVYPHPSFEAEVKIGENLYYFNIDVENKEKLVVETEEDLIDKAWAYTESLDYVNFDDPKYEFIYDYEIDVYKEMANIWNKNPHRNNTQKWFTSEEWMQRKSKKGSLSPKKGSNETLNETEVKQQTAQDVWNFLKTLRSLPREDLVEISGKTQTATWSVQDLIEYINDKYTYQEAKSRYDVWMNSKKKEEEAERNKVVALAKEIGFRKLYSFVKELKEKHPV